MIGINKSSNKFNAAILSQYPSELCRFLAERFGKSFLANGIELHKAGKPDNYLGIES
jgi:hypothetical protein